MFLICLLEITSTLDVDDDNWFWENEPDVINPRHTNTSIGENLEVGLLVK